MSLKFVILGSGSSMGVPRADGYSGDCDLKNKKNFRTRCSALIKFNDQNILIDTSPDLRSQLLKNKLNLLVKFFIPIFMLTRHMVLMTFDHFF